MIRTLITAAATALVLSTGGFADDGTPPVRDPQQTAPKGCIVIFPKGGGWPVNGVFVPRKDGQKTLMICSR